MPNLNELLTFYFTNEHVFEHDLLVKNNFSNPNIFIANSDLKKRWYVYFSYRNSKTGKLKRTKIIYGKTNSYKTKEDRLLLLFTYRKKLLYLLNHGYNPFEDNSELYQKNQDLDHKKNGVYVTPEPKLKPKNSVSKNLQANFIDQKTIKEAFEFALEMDNQNVAA